MVAEKVSTGVKLKVHLVQKEVLETVKDTAVKYSNGNCLL